MASPVTTRMINLIDVPLVLLKPDLGFLRVLHLDLVAVDAQIEMVELSEIGVISFI